jgi:hypothetical protein
MKTKKPEVENKDVESFIKSGKADTATVLPPEEKKSKKMGRPSFGMPMTQLRVSVPQTQVDALQAAADEIQRSMSPGQGNVSLLARIIISDWLENYEKENKKK